MKTAIDIITTACITAVICAPAGWYYRDYEFYKYDAPKFSQCVPAMSILDEDE